MDRLYSKKTIALFQNPQNLGQMKNPDAQATVSHPECGDITRLFLKIEKKRIEEIKFQTLGCPAAIASASMLTIMAKGKTLKEAAKINKRALAQALGGLPAQKLQCSVLATQALRQAIDDYQKNQKTQGCNSCQP